MASNVLEERASNVLEERISNVLEERISNVLEERASNVLGHLLNPSFPLQQGLKLLFKNMIKNVSKKIRIGIKISKLGGSRTKIGEFRAQTEKMRTERSKRVL